MAKAKKPQTIEELLKEQNELLRHQIIITLGLAGVPQQKIRDIIGGDIRRVNEILKHLKRTSTNA